MDRQFEFYIMRNNSNLHSGIVVDMMIQTSTRLQRKSPTKC